MDPMEITRRRLVNQDLAVPLLNSPAEVVHALGAVQAQDYYGAKWALAQRIQGGSTDSLVEAACSAGTILRTHVLRPTWHFVTPTDIRWALDLTAPRVNAVNAFMYRRYELDDAVFRQSGALLTRALQGGKEKTRAELAAALESGGVPTGDGVRLGLLMMRAELDGIVCSGARKGKQFTYALLAERAPQAKRWNRDEALAELTRRYFSTRGPATLHDFSWWSGLTLSDARRGMEMVKSAFESEDIGGRTSWFPPSAPPPRARAATAHLLSNYDEYFIGFRDRAAFSQGKKKLATDQASVVLAAHILALDGQIVGGWRRVPERNALRVELSLLTELTKAEERAVERAAKRLEEFAEQPVEMKFVASKGTRGIRFAEGIGEK